MESRRNTTTSPAGDTKDTRARVWNIIVYPESAPEDWEDIINDLHIKWAKSPLHDKDVNPTGELKKPHWHLVLAFEGKQSYDFVFELTKRLNTVVPVRCRSTSGSIRYMAHLDNPEKYQYDMNDVKCYGGMKLDDYLDLRPTGTERYKCIKEMTEFIVENDIVEMVELVMYASEHRFNDWFPLLCDNSGRIIGDFITSNRHQHRKPKAYVMGDDIVDIDGEVIGQVSSDYKKLKKRYRIIEGRDYE